MTTNYTQFIDWHFVLDGLYSLHDVFPRYVDIVKGTSPVSQFEFYEKFLFV